MDSAPILASLSTTSSAKIEIKNVKETIFNHAKELHHLYQQGNDLVMAATPYLGRTLKRFFNSLYYNSI